MTPARLNEFVDRFIDQQKDILKTKGHDYAGEGDRLSNFKRVGQAIGQDALVAWAVYFLKHVDSILTFVRERKLASEPIEGRLLDAANYCILGAALVEELYTPAHEQLAAVRGLEAATGKPYLTGGNEYEEGFVR